MAYATTELAVGPGEQRVKIALICPYDMGRSGGVQTVVFELAKRLDGDDVSTVVIGPGTPGESSVRTVDVGRTVTIRTNRSSNQLALGPRVRGRIAEAVEGSDLIHVHEPFVPMVSIAATNLGIPRLLTFHADPTTTMRGVYRLASPLLGGFLRGSTITAVSPVAASALRPRWGNVEIVPNGIDHASFNIDTERHPRRVVFLGRDDPRKGLDVLLDAWSIIRQRVPDAELIVVGAQRGNPPAGVRYLGHVSEGTKRLALAASAVYVAPNTGGESFGIVVAEAMAAGCAVVASDLPAFRWVARDAASYFPVGDPVRLAAEVISLLDDSAVRADRGALAQRGAARFDWKVVVDRYRSLYESMLQTFEPGTT
ncbi:MAG: glycosyltransferase [Acidimicrobiia bacterium]|nr:glycosyltransferase [Acidimicrobiia bacterium]